MAGYYQICPNISISSLTDHAGILWGQKSDDFGDFCGAIYFNTSDQLVLSGHSSTVYSTSSDNLFSVDSPSGSSLVLKADDGTVDWNRPEMTLYGDLSVTGCIHGTTSTISISTDNGICGGGPLSASRNFALSGQASNLHNATFSNGDLLAKDGNGTFVGVTSSDFVVAVSGGNCISVTTDSNNITVNHSDTSSLTGVYSNSDNDFIQSITVDCFGHITGISSGTATSGASAAANTHPTQSAIICDLSAGNVLQDITVNTLGHVTYVCSVDLDSRYCQSNTTYSQATSAVLGLVELATNTEVTSGTDSIRAITPSNLTSITKLGTIGTGTWQGTNIADSYIASASAWDSCATSGHTHSQYLCNSDDDEFDGSLTVTENLTVTGNTSSAQLYEGSNRVCTAAYPSNNNQLTNGCGYTTCLGDITGVTAGTDLSGGGATGSVTINHDNISRSNTTSSCTVYNLESFTVVDSISSSDRGHITGINTKTVTIPAVSGAATSTALGLVKLASDTDQTVAANTVTATTNRTYGVQFNSSDQMVVNVPWSDTDTNTDTNTTYSLSAAGAGGSTCIVLSPSTGSDDCVVIAPGNCISVTCTDADTITINHSDTSSQTSVACSSRTYISAVTLDSFGHVTGLDTENESNAHAGAQNYIPIWSSNTALSSSCLCQSGTTVIAKNNLTVQGNISANGLLYGAVQATKGTNNTAVGVNALCNITTGQCNTAIGCLSLYSNTTGSYNTATGIQSLYSNLSGDRNTASGYRSLYSNTTGCYNTANGFQSLFSNTTGNNNTATGYYSLYLNTTGIYNTATGNDSLYSNTTGAYNTATGNASLFCNTTGSCNTASGRLSLYLNTTGSCNTASGFQSLYSNTTGTNNTASGYQSLYSNTSSDYNTAIGFKSLYSITTGLELFGTNFSHNTASGMCALYSNTTGYYNTSIGAYSLLSNTTGSFNTASGYKSLYLNTTGNNNTASGCASLESNTTGAQNTASGVSSLYYNTTGNNNTASGYVSLWCNTTGNSNTASGAHSLRLNTTGNSNTASGCASLYNNTTGSNNTASGAHSLRLNTTGSNNTATGLYALNSNTTGSCNTSTGRSALYSNTTGSWNTASGMYALSGTTTGSCNIGIGYNAVPSTAAGVNQIVIGVNATGAGDNQTVIGNSNTTHTKLCGTLYTENLTVTGNVTAAQLYESSNRVCTGAYPTVSNAQITITGGTSLGTGGSFTLNQAGNNTITINHDNISRSDTSSICSPGYGGSFGIVDSVTSNAQGHITAVNIKTVSLPSADDTNTTYTLNAIDGSGDVTVRLSGTNSINDDVILCGSSGVSVNSSGDNITIAGPDLSSYCQSHSHSEYASCAEGHTQTTVASNSANWDLCAEGHTQTTVASNSANWDLCAEGHTQTTVASNSANWDNAYTNVATNSGNWNDCATSGHTHSQYLLNTTDTFTGCLTVTSNVTAAQLYEGSNRVCTGVYPTASNAEITIAGGTSLGTGGSFTLNQAGNNTITINHDNISRSDTSGICSPGYGGSFGIIDSVTSNAQGHITAVNIRTVSLPSADDTNTTYTLNAIDGSGDVTVRLSGTNSINDDVILSGSSGVSINSSGDNITIAGPNLSSYCQTHSHSEYDNCAEGHTQTTVTSNSANWNNAYTNVASNSGNWNDGAEGHTQTTVASNSASWNNAYTNVASNSGNWNNCATSNHVHSQYLLNNANDEFAGNLTVTGNVTAAQLYDDGNRVCTSAYPSNNNQLTNGSGYTSCTGSVNSVAVTVGTGLGVTGSPVTTSGTIGLTLDLSEFSTMAGALDGAADSMILLDGGAQKKALLCTVNLGEFCNNQNWNYYSHPTQTSISIDNSAGNVLQDITVNTLGHVISVDSVDLDSRYYTESEVDTKITAAVDGLVNAAPGTLDTLNELAAALGDDANFTTTITNSLANKQNSLTFGIANTNAVCICSTTVADNEYARFTACGLEGRTIGEVRTDIGVGDGKLTEKNFTSTLKTKLDGIATSANNYSLPEATATARGGIELFSNTDQACAANSVSSTTSRTYGIQLNSAGQAVVNVPWVDTNDYVDAVSFSSSTGVLTIGRSGALTNLTTSLDNRYCRDNTTYAAGDGIGLSNGFFSITAGTGLYQTSTGLCLNSACVTAIGLGTVAHSWGDHAEVGYCTTTSDYRAKTCIEQYDTGYDTVKNVDTYEYVFKDDENKDHHIGMMAHELQENGVVYGVTGYKDEVDKAGDPVYQTVSLQKLVPTLWSALKTAIVKIEKLEARLDM